MLYLAVLLTTATEISQAQTVRPIRIGEPVVERTVFAGQSDIYTLAVAAGRFVRGVADQKSVDVVVRVLDPAGRWVATFDDPARGPEAFQFTTFVSGEHRIEIAAFEKDSGVYTLRLDRSEPVATNAEARVAQIMSNYDRNSPGGVVAVVRDGKITYVRGFGMANLEYDVPNGPETVFHMASVSKQFTAFAILLLADQGKLSLDDDVRKHLPEMPDFGTPIKIRNLVHHTSGLRDQWTLWAMAGGRRDDVITQDDLLSLIRRQKELNFVPGAEDVYSNTGYSLMAEIVTRVTGDPFGVWMKRNIFEPLGMTNTQIYDDHERLVKNRAYSYRRNRDGAWAKSVLSYANRGATSLFTTAGDLALWLGNFKTAKVGGRSVIERMKERGRLSNGDSIPYAFGIVHAEQRGIKMLVHGGADAGYRTLLAYYPELDAGVIALGNEAEFNSGAILRDVTEAFFGERMTPRTAPAAPSTPPATPQTPAWTPSAKDLEAFTGVYYSPELEARYTVLIKDGKLVAQHRRHGDHALRPSKENSFTTPAWYFSTLNFERGADGRVTGMRVSSAGVRRLLFERLP